MEGTKMYSRLQRALLTASIVALLAAPSMAQQDPDWRDCNIRDPKSASDIAAKIAGCTRVLDRGQSTARNTAIALANRGVAYQNKGEIDRAIADFGEAIRVDPEFPNWRYARGTQYANKGELQRALADFNEAVRLRPNTPEYLEAVRRVQQMIASAGDKAPPATPSPVTSPAATPPPANVYRMLVQSHPDSGTLCLGVVNSQFVEGARLQTSDCSSTPNQIFTYDQGTEALTIGGLCVALGGQRLANSTIGLTACTGEASQHWRMVEAGDFYRVVGIGERCLDSISLLVPQNCVAQTSSQLWALMAAP